MNPLFLLGAGLYVAAFGVHDMIHVANVVYLASYLVKDILWLRILTVVGIICLVPYYLACAENPLWDAIAWSSLFATVNLFQIFLLVKERWPVSLIGMEREVYDRIFHSLTPGEFVKLLNLGEWREHPEGEALVKDGEVVEQMMLLCQGEAVVQKGELEIARLRPGQFVGEMSFITRNKASANVVSVSATQVLTWPQKELQAYLDKKGDVAFKLRGVLGTDLVRKLQKDETPLLGASHAIS